MPLPAFYECTDFSSTVFCLSDREAAHARVLRLGQGDRVEVFNGMGARAVCSIRQISRKSVGLDLESVNRVERPRARAIIATAVSKAVRRGFFMEKAAELGAWEIWVWQGSRSVGGISSGLMDSCRQQIIAGGKQARNPWFPRLINVANLAGLLERAEKTAPALRVLPWEDQDRSVMLMPDQLGVAGDTIFAIGPEGGYAPGEKEQLVGAGFNPVSLGRQVLRCETAAVLCLGLHTWASQLPGAPDSAVIP